MPDKELTIIIITYNSKEVIEKCLKNIGSEKFEILVIDNASRDGTADFVATKFPEVKLIRSEKNCGYGRAANMGFKAASTEYCLLMNPDVITSTADILKLLERSKLHEKAVISAPLTDVVDKYKGEAAADQKVIWVSGGVMMFNMANLAKVGRFDENIFLFYEETDLCERIIEMDYEIVLFNDIYFEHLIGKSSTPNPKTDWLKFWHFAWSRFYFNKKHLPVLEYYRKAAGYLLKFTIKCLIYTLTGNKEKKIKYEASLVGSISFLRGVTAFDENDNPRGVAK